MKAKCRCASEDTELLLLHMLMVLQSLACIILAVANRKRRSVLEPGGLNVERVYAWRPGDGCHHPADLNARNSYWGLEWKASTRSTGLANLRF